MWSGENPIKKIKLPRLNNKRKRFFSKEEAAELLEALAKRSTQLRDMAFLSLMTGMRAGEIFNLKWEHIDIENRIIRVLESRSGGARKVHINTDVIEMLSSYRTKNLGNYLFKNRNGLKAVQVSKVFRSVVNRLGFNDGVEDRRDRLTFHSLRHTFASWLAIKGTPILTIKELLGHKTLTMTERYAHLIPD